MRAETARPSSDLRRMLAFRPEHVTSIVELNDRLPRFFVIVSHNRSHHGPTRVVVEADLRAYAEPRSLCWESATGDVLDITHL